MLCRILTDTKSTCTSIGTITYVAHTIFENIIDDTPIVWGIFVSLAMPMMSMLVPETVFLALIASFPTTEAASASNRTISAATNAREPNTKKSSVYIADSMQPRRSQ
jgi:hypothetical protein